MGIDGILYEKSSIYWPGLAISICINIWTIKDNHKIFDDKIEAWLKNGKKKNSFFAILIDGKIYFLYKECVNDTEE